ncbi:hypothetical protein B0H65DRAFT_447004 [Neurospora tetraspora]|uniref:Uncharacterized protein n=1 Tax=Neurospora tetraspora TaxID=94610 RepID=A0AAE0MKE1_9PEZI|nr:hypothetical protein B0H65DRAFT_447004 [Neurospora tetraspora]
MALRLGELVGNLHGVLTVGAVENRHPLGVLTPAFPFFPINIGVLPLLVIMLLAVLGVFKLSPVRASQELRFSNPKASTCEDTPGRAPLPFYLEVPYQSVEALSGTKMHNKVRNDLRLWGAFPGV